MFLIWLTQFIPLVQIITFFVSFPITYTAMIIYFQKMTGEQMSTTYAPEPAVNEEESPFVVAKTRSKKWK